MCVCFYARIVQCSGAKSVKVVDGSAQINIGEPRPTEYIDTHLDNRHQSHLLNNGGRNPTIFVVFHGDLSSVIVLRYLELAVWNVFGKFRYFQLSNTRGDGIN